MRLTIMGEEIKFFVYRVIPFLFLKSFCEFVCCKGHRQIFGDRYTRGKHLHEPNKKGTHTIEIGMEEVVNDDSKQQKGDHADALWVGTLPAWTGFSV